MSSMAVTGGQVQAMASVTCNTILHNLVNFVPVALPQF